MRFFASSYCISRLRASTAAGSFVAPLAARGCSTEVVPPVALMRRCARARLVERDERRPHLVGSRARERVLAVARRSRLRVVLELAAHEDGRLRAPQQAGAAAALARDAVAHVAARRHRAGARRRSGSRAPRSSEPSPSSTMRGSRVSSERARGGVVGRVAGPALAPRLLERHRRPRTRRRARRRVGGSRIATNVSLSTRRARRGRPARRGSAVSSERSRAPERAWRPARRLDR